MSASMWPSSTAKSPAPADLPRERGPRVSVFHKDADQAHLILGVPSYPIDHPDRYALQLLANVLGGGMSSRLFSRLREELGLCYDIHSYMSTLLDTGMFGIYAGVDPANAHETVREIARELARSLRSITPEELDRAKAVSRSRTQLRLEDTRSVSAMYGSLAVLGLPLRSVEIEMGPSQVEMTFEPRAGGSSTWEASAASRSLPSSGPTVRPSLRWRR